MRFKHYFLASSLLFICACSPNSFSGIAQINQESTTFPVPPGLGAPNNPTQTPPGEDDIVGASSGFITNLENAQVPVWPNMSSGYLFNLTQGNTNIPLTYRTLSGDTVYAHVWFYVKNTWQAMGWQYNPSNPSQFSKSLIPPAQAQAIFVGFFSFKGGNVAASLSTSPTSQSKESIFSEAGRRSPISLGTATTAIIPASTSGVWKQEFSNGAILWREGQSQAFALPQPFWNTWKTSGQMTVYGLPVGDVQSGRTIQGISSRFQMYEGTNSPSLHSSALGTWRFYKQTLDVWNSNGNYDKLGHPIGDAENGSQRFQHGEIRNGQVILQATTAVSPGSRSADFKNVWSKLESSADSVNTPQLRGGNASHNLSPAELIYFCAKENDINPVLLLAKLQDEQSLIEQGKPWSTEPDFEWRLARATGYKQKDSVDTPEFYGFYPQLIGASYQFYIYQNRDHKTFRAAYETYTSDKTKYYSFVNSLYPKYVKGMNKVTGKSYLETPSDYGYYKDFRDISIQHIQRFLESYSGALKETDLFRQAPLASNKVSY